VVKLGVPSNLKASASLSRCFQDIALVYRPLTTNTALRCLTQMGAILNHSRCGSIGANQWYVFILSTFLCPLLPRSAHPPPALLCGDRLGRRQILVIIIPLRDRDHVTGA
jgi:hypothetical protein